MQPALLLSRLLAPGMEAAAAACAAAARQQQQLLRPSCRRSASSSAAPSSSTSSSSSSSAPAAQPGPLDNLSPEQQQHVAALRYLVARPLAAARDAALLTGLAAGYRDLFAVMDLMHKRDILGVPHPLLDEPPSASASGGAGGEAGAAAAAADDGAAASQQQQQQQPSHAANSTQMTYPVRDLSLLPDEPPPEGGWLRNHLQPRYMTRITAFAQLLPNHLEVSYQTGAFVFLWPPMEVFYPGLFDVSNALRHLQPHFKRSRTTRSRRLSKPRCRLGWQRNKPYHKQRVFG